MSDILEKLRDSQKTLFVGIAGPGTGKSTAFKEIIESEEFKGKKILILSFINKLVDDLKGDFEEFQNVEVSTLHSFAMKHLGEIRNQGEIHLDPDLDSIISQDHKLIKGSDIEYEKKFHEDSLSVDEIEFYKERAEYYKHQNELYSFNSVIFGVNRSFERFDQRIPSNYDLILIDEFQDFNKSEYELIKLLNNKNKVLLVGDDDQSLYAFKSARPEQIRDLYNDVASEEFSLDSCYRCTEVVVNATNSLVESAKKQGLLASRLDKKFLYPARDEKDEIGKKHPKIEFLPCLKGDQLIYNLEKGIRENAKEGNKRILIIAPGYLKQTLYDGLSKKKINVVEHENLGDEKRSKLVACFKVLEARKTDNAALRKILDMYLSEADLATLLQKCANESKKLWSCLASDVKTKIESDTALLKKVRQGKDDLNNAELERFSELFKLKKILSKMVQGFGSNARNAIQVEMTTVMSSKGLSADFVYYIGIDDENTLDRDTKQLTDGKVCEFLVGITRAKEKLTLISLQDQRPKVLDLIDASHIQTINR